MNLKSAIKYTVVAVIAGMPVACDDDPFGKNSGFSSDAPVFNAELSSSWHKGTPTSRSRSAEIRIDEAETTLSDGTQLYLVTEKHVLDSCKADADPRARGAQINSMDLFPVSFGLSAFCHTGNIADYGKDEIVSNFVGNVAIKKDGYPVDNNDNLNWPGKGSNVTFYAYAPFADGVNGVQAVSGKPELTLTVNKNIKDQIDLLTAVSKDCSGDGSEGKVDLKFGHALSAVTFVAGDAMMAGTIKKITLSGVYATGGTVIGSATWTSLSNVSEFTTGDISLEVNNGGDYYNVYSDKGSQITGGDENLTMFMIPQTLPAGARIKIDFVDALSASSHTIEADISGFKWEPGKLYKYSLSTSGITVTPVVEILDYKKTPKTYPDKDDAYKIKTSEVVVPYSGVLDDVKLKAYLRIARAGQTGESVVGSSFTVAASTDGGTTWVDGKGDAAGTCRWIADASATVSRAAGSEVTGTLLLPAQPVFSRLSTWTEPGNGTKDAPVDLSGGGETANCYRITDHGYYKIPLYYGNSRNSSGGENASAYTMTNMESDGFLFYPDHMGNAITKGKISEQLSGKVSLKDALLLWQDAPGLIDDVALDGDFITFHAGKYALTQGNALIALRDDKGDIVWSWHIWSTDSKWEDNLKYTTSKIGAGKPYKLTSTNLGYCDPHGGNDARDIKLKFVFDYKDASGKSYEYVYPDAFRQDEIIASNAGDNTYYQWGRKDPMLPGIYTNTSKTYDSNAAASNDRSIHYYPIAGWSDNGEMSMINKPFFDSPDEYGFKSITKGAKTAEGEGISVVDAIKNPHCHVIGVSTPGYHREHWHNGNGESYVSAGVSVHRMNHAWNSSASFNGEKDNLVAGNDIDVVKTIYDPSPAGFHVPSVGAYTGLADVGGGTKAAVYPDNIPTFDGVKWTLKCENGSIEFPATGMRDTNLKSDPVSGTPLYKHVPSDLYAASWPGFQLASFVSSSTIVYDLTESTLARRLQVLILDFDNRKAGSGRTDLYKYRLASCVKSYNSYGLSVRPVSDN